jgi:membrane protease YdiL (CAAX protease family)
MDAATPRLMLSAIPVFARLAGDRWDTLEGHLAVVSHAPGDRVVEEGQDNPGRFYIVLEGEAAICNRGRSVIDGEVADFEIEVRRKHEILGAISFLDGRPFSSTIMAKTPLTLAVVDFAAPDCSVASRRLRASIVSELRQQLATDLRSLIAGRLESLRMESDFARYKNAVGRIVVTTLSLLSFYTLALSALPKFELALEVNFAISPFIIAFFAVVLGPVILRSGFPPSFFGIQTANWRGALGFSVLVSLAFIATGAALKLILIHTTESFSHLSLFGVADVKVNMHQVMMSPFYWLAVGLYLVLTPIQEFVARCCLQAPLHAFITGSEPRRLVWSILVSNLVFAAAHSHISFAFAIAAFVPGIFWGWIFARTNSLIAASASHFMIGGAGIFLFGIEDVVAAIAG